MPAVAEVVLISADDFRVRFLEGKLLHSPTPSI